MKFVDPAGTYNNYTSEIIKRYVNIPGGSNRAVIQVKITSGDVKLYADASGDDANFILAHTFTVSSVDEVVVTPRMRIVATGEAEVWLGV
jgi:hypothetical protein